MLAWLSALTATAFFKNILLGISLAAPIGPVSIETIKQGLTHGFKRAFSLVFGAAIGDLATMFVVYFSLSKFIDIPLVKMTLWMFGAVILLYLGMGSIRQSFQKGQMLQDFLPSERNVFVLGFVLAVVNPMSIVWWLGVIGSLVQDVGPELNFIENMLPYFSIFVGVLIWGFFLSSWLAFGRQYLNDKALRVISFLSGLCLAVFGGMYLIEALATIL